MSNSQTAIVRFRAAVEEEMKATHCTRDIAASRVQRREPELVAELIEEANSDRRPAA